MTDLTALDTRDVLATLNIIVPRLRPLIRRTDELLIAHDGAAVLLRDPAPEGARIVAQRLRNALTDLTDHAGSSSALAADTNVRQGVQRLQTLLGIGCVTFDATGAILNNDSPCDEDDEDADNHGGERHYPSVAPIVSIAHASSAGDVSDDAFDARFARLFAHAWESTAQSPGAIALIDAWQVGADPAVLGATAGATEAQQELALRRQATMLGVPFARLPTLLPGACRRAISRTLASELRAIPIGYAHATLTVAMEHPCDAQAVKRLRQATGHTIFPVLGASDEIARAITQLKP